ncbi:hypothetical protein QUF72_10150 [Desulfobacterales bacterium HSG2]|nr:hypothetical protein [Desulfobacterales bacterium HSG2]
MIEGSAESLATVLVYMKKAIDLIDGNQLIDKLKEVGLGVKTEKVEVEQVTINRNWFMDI